MLEVRPPNNLKFSVFDCIYDADVGDALSAKKLCVVLEELVLVFGLLFEIGFSISAEYHSILHLIKANHLAQNKHECASLA